MIWANWEWECALLEMKWGLHNNGFLICAMFPYGKLPKYIRKVPNVERQIVEPWNNFQRSSFGTFRLNKVASDLYANSIGEHILLCYAMLMRTLRGQSLVLSWSKSNSKWIQRRRHMQDLSASSDCSRFRMKSICMICRHSLQGNSMLLSAALGKTGSKVETCTIMCFIFPVAKEMFMWPQFAIICRVLPKNVCLPSWLAVAYEHHMNHSFFSFPKRRKRLCYAVFCRLLCGFFIFDRIGSNRQYGAKQGKLRTSLVVKS